MARVKRVKKGAPHPSGGTAVAQKSLRGIECFDEDDVLLPISGQSHPDDWPCFVLQDAVVLDKAGNHANLLNAEISGPLFVRGRLEADKELKHLRKIRDLKGAQLSVSSVSGFSMGTGPITIWALGNIRWFEINPAAEYRKMYKKMTEGVGLYYFLVEVYESRRTKSKQTVSMDYILKEFSEHRGNSVSQEEFVKVCSEHALFLFSQMLKPHEPVLWPLTKFYKWLVEHCSDAYDRYKDGVGKGAEAAPPEILKTLKHLYTSGRHRREKLTLRQLSRAMFETYDFSSLLLAQEYIRVHAESLLSELKPAWQEEDWHLTPLYLKLEETLENPGKENGLRHEATHINLKRRICGNKISIDATFEDDIDDHPIANIMKSTQIESKESAISDDTSSVTSSSTSQSEGKRHRKASKGKGRHISNRDHIDDDEDMPDVTDLNNSSEDEQNRSLPSGHVLATSTPQSRARVGPSRSGKKAALRLIKSDDVLQSSNLQSPDPEEDYERSRKRRKISPSALDDAESISNSSNESLRSDDDEDVEDEALEDVDVKFTLDSELLPSTTPQGSNGLWTCDRKGCNHTITKADEPNGKSQVYEHLKEHASEIAARENLVLKEAKGGLKVDHLLEKIRKLGAEARLAKQKTINGRIVPLPIQRQMLS